MTESLTKADGTNTPIGTLANYSLTHTATPVDPRDSTGQIPTFNATVTDPQVDTKGIVGTDITLEDWTGTVSTGRAVATNRNAKSGAVSIDSNTVFERLNTTQTTLPIIYSELADGVDPVYEALNHWMLMAGVPKHRLDGNLLHYIDSEYIGTSSYGYIADSISKFRFSGPPAEYNKFVPSAEKYTNPIDVNQSQSVTIGGRFYTSRTLSEARIKAHLNYSDVPVYYSLRRNGTTWTLREQVGLNAETVLLTATHTPTGQEDQLYVFAQVRAHPTVSTQVNITLRIMERNTIGLTSIFDTTVSGVESTLRRRPRPYEVEVGYPPLLVGTHTDYGRPAAYFMLQKPVMQDKYPEDYFYLATGIYEDFAEWKAKMPYKIPGFTGNVWEKMREFCSLCELDVGFEEDIIVVRPRKDKRETLYDNDFIPALNVNKSNLSESFSEREPARSVEVLWRTMEGSENDYANTLIWKADSVYTLEKGETREEIIQTDASFVYLHPPVIVSGVPVPYTSAFSSYVITGADGFIVSPQWWLDNGGSIKAYNTANSGEIKLVMQAPSVDTTRAPYRVSEGAADRPAIYIKGYGMKMTAPKTVKVYTGADGASQDVGVTFDSIFVTKKLMAFNAGHKLAVTYGSASSTIRFNISKADQPAPQDSDDPLTPLADCVYWGGSYYRIADESTTPRAILVNKADQFNTIRVVNGEFATGKTIADWNTLHAGKLLRDTNAAPLPRYVS